MPDPDRPRPCRYPLSRWASLSLSALIASAALGTEGARSPDPPGGLKTQRTGMVRATELGTPDAAAPGTLATPLKSSHACLASGDGYLRARIRGALTLDVDLHNSELECDGGARPDGSGIRVSFAGPLRSDGRRLRMVFGIAGAAEGAHGRSRPTNLTIIFEGEERIFATRGEDKCTTDDLQQERLGALAGLRRTYRIIARGFCIAPVTALNNNSAVFVNSFDFAGSITFDDSH
jgi:hypothetical protein